MSMAPVLQSWRNQRLPDPGFFDAEPDPDWHQNNADPHGDPTPGFTQVGQWCNIFLFFTFIHSNACLQCFKEYMCFESDTDPERVK